MPRVHRAIHHNTATRDDVTQRDARRPPVSRDILRTAANPLEPSVRSLLIIQCQFVQLPRLESDLKAMLIRDSSACSPPLPLVLLSNLRFTLADPRTYCFILRFIHYHNGHQTYLPVIPDFLVEKTTTFLRYNIYK